MKTRLYALALILIPSVALAQSETRPTTPAGNDVNVGVSGYNYIEPGTLRISIHGLKISGEYTGTLTIAPRRHWFAKVNARASIGRTAYDGWCAPWLIGPNSASPNGYALDLGDYSPCSDSGNRDWYVEARGLVGKDLVGRTWSWSPETGLGVRHLSNGISGINGFRIDKYLYVPIGLTARTRSASGNALVLNVEYDRLLHGWQTTYDSALGSGVVPATPTAPAFSIDGFGDFSFDQHRGWGLRTSGKYEFTRGWSLEPYYVHWRVDDSTVSFAPVTFTVNGISAVQQLGAYEPVNSTHEFGVKIGVRWR